MDFSSTPQGIPTGIADFAALKANWNMDVVRKLGLRQLEWLFAIPFQVTVPANGGTDDQVDIKPDAHFQCEFITGDFTTIEAGDPAATDDGTNHISIRISDGSNDLKLMEDFVPANLFLSPGRVLAPGVAGNPSSQLFYPFPFQHIFPANGAIVIEAQNNAGEDNTLNLLFWGKKLKASIANSPDSRS